jgi:hypothetical protein
MTFEVFLFSIHINSAAIPSILAYKSRPPSPFHSALICALSLALVACCSVVSYCATCRCRATPCLAALLLLDCCLLAPPNSPIVLCVSIHSWSPYPLLCSSTHAKKNLPQLVVAPCRELESKVENGVF